MVFCWKKHNYQVPYQLFTVISVISYHGKSLHVEKNKRNMLHLASRAAALELYYSYCRNYSRAEWGQLSTSFLSLASTYLLRTIPTTKQTLTHAQSVIDARDSIKVFYQVFKTKDDSRQRKWREWALPSFLPPPLPHSPLRHSRPSARIRTKLGSCIRGRSRGRGGMPRAAGGVRSPRSSTPPEARTACQDITHDTWHHRRANTV